MIVTGSAIVDWMRSRSSEIGDSPAQGIGWHDGKELVAGVAYTDFNGVNLNMHVVAVPGKRWLTREYLWTCFDYPFNQCKVRRVTGLVGEGNKEARKFDEHLGFELETTLKHAHPTGDLLVYRMFREQCKWIGRDTFKRALAAA